MKRFCCWVGLILAGCAHPVVRDSVKGPGSDFSGLRDAYLSHWKEANPVAAVALGFHEYDGRLVVPDADELVSEQKTLHHYAEAFAAINPGALNEEQRYDRQLLIQWIATDLWSLETQRAPYRNPMTYAAALDISVYLKRDWKAWTERVRDLTLCLNHSPQVLAAARQNLESNLSRPLVETAIEVAEGTASFLQNEVTHEVQSVNDARVREDFARVAGKTISGLKEYAEWLKRDRLPKATAPFALGTEGFAARLKAEMVDLSPREVLEIGLKELRSEQERFAQAAREIDPSLSAIAVFKAIQKDHPTAEGLIPDTRRDLEMIRQFVIEHRLVTIPSEVRATVRETLPPFRSTSFASMDTPGPFESKATEAFYYVTPVESEWPEAQKDEWLTAFNYYTTDVVSIHEAYPGHYVQFLALNASGASEVAKLYYSYAFVEGWAHYTEQMVLDAGFQGAPTTGDSRQRAAKFRLAQSDEALLRLCRLCVAIQMHCNGMTLV